jgi:hypothetical protein
VLDLADLNADWPAVQAQMRHFHGYPYTSIGIRLTSRHLA